jgi:hypothetical protein
VKVKNSLMVRLWDTAAQYPCLKAQAFKCAFKQDFVKKKGFFRAKFLKNKGYF